MKFITLLYVSVLFINYSFSQSDTIYFQKRRYITYSTILGSYSAGMFALYQTWYKNYPQSNFHWFNDKNEWLQMDKIGHSFTSYHITEQLHQQFLWSGYSNNQSLLLSSILSFSMMTGIEIFDAYSEKWGASSYDILSNFVGTFFFTGQMLIFKKQMFHIKFSFYPSSYAQKRPEALGYHLPEQIIKDYNGQTYWLSINLHNAGLTSIPQWFELSFGYGAEGMIYATGNLNQYRQYYFSFDINPNYLKFRNKWIKAIFIPFKIIKFPFPTLEYSQRNFKVYYLK